MVSGDNRELLMQLEKLEKRDKKELDRLDRGIQELQKERDEVWQRYEPTIRLKQKLEGKSKPVTPGRVELPLESDFNRLSIKEAALRILREANKPMSSSELVEQIRKRGKDMPSPHSVYMVSLTLKKIPDLVERKRKGKSNYFVWKHQQVQNES